MCYGLWNKRRITQSCQVNPGEAVGKTSTERMSKLKREPGLAYPTWPGQREQTHPTRLQKVQCLGDLLLPPEQRSGRERKHLQGSGFRVVCWERGSCGCKQRGPRLSLQVHGPRQQVERVIARRTAETSFQVADGASTEAGTFGQRLLRQSRSHAIALEQRPKGGRFHLLCPPGDLSS